MHTRNISVGQQTLSIETGRLAKQADGAVIVRSGDTMVLVTACAAASPREGIDFLPLTVDYREYAYASGRIPGGFFKRESKPSEKEVLTSRFIDRPIRPLFPAGWRHETQIIAFVISADTAQDSDVLAITGASAALALSSIPFTRTIAGVRMGLVDGEYLVNPTFEQRRKSQLDLIVAGSKDAIVMVEAGAKEVSEDVILKALDLAHAAIKEIIVGIEALAKDAGKPKRAFAVKEIDAAVRKEVEAKAYAPLSAAMQIKDKLENYSKVDAALADLLASIPEEDAQKRSDAKHIFKELKEKVMKDEALERGRRLDGRKFDEIRNITIEAGVLPRTHGSTVFTRGETQALVTVTLGTADDQQKVEMVDGETWKRFMLHYNFPPFSVGEVQFLRGPGRREIGHGALAERALAPMIPAEENFPYTIRVVSDILESNGSSSMASVCGGSIAMMDAGVPIKAPVAGMAMGLIMDDQTGKYAVLSRHRRRRRPLRRHGLQGRRIGRRHHGAADGHQGRGHHDRDHEEGARAGAAGTALHPRQDESGDPEEPLRCLGLRAAYRDDPHPGRQDPRRHRTRRQDDPQHHRAHGRQDRRRGRWPRECGLGRRGLGAEGDRDHPGADRDARAEQDLHGQGSAHHRFRRVRRNHARPRRPVARLGDRALPREGRPRRAEGRRSGHGQGDQHRPLGQDPTQP